MAATKGVNKAIETRRTAHQRLRDKDPEFGKLNKQIADAQRAEKDYVKSKSPRLGELEKIIAQKE